MMKAGSRGFVEVLAEEEPAKAHLGEVAEEEAIAESHCHSLHTYMGELGSSGTPGGIPLRERAPSGRAASPSGRFSGPVSEQDANTRITSWADSLEEEEAEGRQAECSYRLDSCSAELMPLEDGVEEGAGIQEQEEEEAVIQSVLQTKRGQNTRRHTCPSAYGAKSA